MSELTEENPEISDENKAKEGEEKKQTESNNRKSIESSKYSHTQP